MEPQRPLDLASFPRMATHPPTHLLLSTCQVQPWLCLGRVSGIPGVPHYSSSWGAGDGTPASCMLGKPLSMEPQPLNFLLFVLLSQGLDGFHSVCLSSTGWSHYST